MLTQYLSKHRIESPQNIFMPDHQVSLRPQGVENTRQLDGDVTSTYDCDPLRLSLDVEESIRVDTVRSAGDRLIRWNGGSSSNCDDNFLRFDGVLCTILLLDQELVL